MKAHVPFHYYVSYKPVRAIKDRHATFASEGLIEFRSVARDAVRTVMRAGKLPGDGDRACDREWHFENPLVPLPNGDMREVVLFEDNLWIEAVPAADTIEKLEKHAGKGTPFLTRYAGEALLKESDNPNFLPHQRPVIFTDRQQVEQMVWRMQKAKLRTFEDDGGDAVRRRLQRTADAFIEIDGMFYARFREPMLRIGGRYSEKSIEFCGSRDNVDHPSRLKYAAASGSVFEEERAMLWSLSEEVAGCSEWRRNENEVIKTQVRYDVLDPDVLVACPHIEAFLYSATSTLRALWAHPLALHHGVINQAVELRDALAACGNQITPRLRRAVEEVARITPLPAEEVDLWRQRAAGRPRMLTHRGYLHHGSEVPLTRASQVIAYVNAHVEAAESAQRALRRLDLRNRRLSWEERALEINTCPGDGLVSYELLSCQAVAQHATKLGVRSETAIRAARYEDARVFAVGRGMDSVGPVLIAVVDEAPDGSLSIRTVHSGEPPEADALELLERHMAAAAPAPEPCCVLGM